MEAQNQAARRATEMQNAARPGASTNHVGFAMIQDTQVALVAVSSLPKDSAWLGHDQVLRFGVGSDLELIFFHMNMTPADKEFLAGVKIKLDSPVVYG